MNTFYEVREARSPELGRHLKAVIGAGVSIGEACRAMVALAMERRMTVVTKFNDIRLVARPSDSVEDVGKQWEAVQHERHEAREAVEAERLAAAKRLWAATEHMLDILAPVGWGKSLAARELSDALAEAERLGLKP